MSSQQLLSWLQTISDLPDKQQDVLSAGQTLEYTGQTISDLPDKQQDDPQGRGSGPKRPGIKQFPTCRTNSRTAGASAYLRGGDIQTTSDLPDIQQDQRLRDKLADVTSKQTMSDLPDRQQDS